MWPIVYTVLSVVGLLVASVYAFLKHRFGYWERRKVRGPKPAIPWGNLGPSVWGELSCTAEFDNIYNDFCDEPYAGFFFCHEPKLMLHDPEIIKQVLVKEFHDFNGRGMYSDPKKDPLSGHLFILSGATWKNLRAKLSPTFTTGKIKYMFDKVQNCAQNMQDYLLEEASAKGGSHVEDIRELYARLYTDIISSVAFGLDSNSIKDNDSELRRMGHLTFSPSFETGTRFIFSIFGRTIMEKLWVNVQSAPVNEFFMRVTKETVKHREEKNIQRADMLNLLMQLKNQGFLSIGEKDDGEKRVLKENQRLTMEEIAAQVFVIFNAGFETTSSTSSFLLYEAARQPHILERLIQEVDEVMKRHNGVISYETTLDTPYLDMCMNETLRMYPPVPFLSREAMRTRNLPLTDLILEKGTQIIIPSTAIHRNPKIWPNPHHFDPERFNAENKPKIPQMVFFPFGEGPRGCVGQRLGVVQVKVGILAILSKFNVTLCDKSPEKVVMEPRSMIPSPVGGLHVKLTCRHPVSA